MRELFAVRNTAAHNPKNNSQNAQFSAGLSVSNALVCLYFS